MDEALLDSDILSEILKGKDSVVVNAGDRYLAQHGRFAFSPRSRSTRSTVDSA